MKKRARRALSIWELSIYHQPGLYSRRGGIREEGRCGGHSRSADPPEDPIAAGARAATLSKIFPAEAEGGPGYVRALKVPLPQIPLVVTEGENQLTAFDYILAGAHAIGVGQSSFAPRSSRAAPG